MTYRSRQRQPIPPPALPSLFPSGQNTEGESYRSVRQRPGRYPRAGQPWLSASFLFGRGGIMSTGRRAFLPWVGEKHGNPPKKLNISQCHQAACIINYSAPQLPPLSHPPSTLLPRSPAARFPPTPRRLHPPSPPLYRSPPGGESRSPPIPRSPCRTNRYRST